MMYLGLMMKLIYRVYHNLNSANRYSIVTLQGLGTRLDPHSYISILVTLVLAT